MKRKVGDKVTIRKDLQVGKHYQKEEFIEDMLQYVGKTAVIKVVNPFDYLIDLDDEEWYWTDDMFESDSVNHPDHYKHGGFECIDEMILVFGLEATATFCLMNVWKYRNRSIYKNGSEDMKKADWYMNQYVDICKKLNESDDNYTISRMIQNTINYTNLNKRGEQK